MGYIVSIITFLIGLANSKKKRWTSPVALYCFQWGIIFLLASLRFFGLYEVSEKAWMLALIGTVSFVVGAKIAQKIVFRSSKHKRSDEHDLVQTKKSYLFFAKLFWPVIIICFLFEIGEFIQVLRLVLSGIDLNTIRQLYYGYEESDFYVRQTGLIHEIKIIFSAFSIVEIAYGIQSFIESSKNYHKMVASLMLILMRSFTSGGRFGLIFFIIEILVCLSIYGINGVKFSLDISVKTKRTIKRVLILVVLALVLITLGRNVKIDQFASKYYRYICGNMVFFDKHMLNFDSNPTYAHSYASLHGLWSIILFFLRYLLGTNYPALFLETERQVMDVQSWVQIGENRMLTNAFITPFFYPYTDFGIIGVIFFMLLFGFFAGHVYRRAEWYDKKAILVYLVITQLIFKTIHFFPLASKEYAWLLIILIISTIFGKTTLHKRGI